MIILLIVSMQNHYLNIIKEKIKRFYIFKAITMSQDLKIYFLKYHNFFLNDFNIINAIFRFLIQLINLYNPYNLLIL